MGVGGRTGNTFESQTRAHKWILSGLGVASALALSVLWFFFGDACGGSLLCGVVPAYFVATFMFLLAAVEVTVTAVCYYRKWVGAL